VYPKGIPNSERKEGPLGDDKKHILTGQILNPELLNKVKKNEELEENEELEVLVIAGSQGSTRIFESVKSILNNLIDVNFTIIL
jgi:UDP-N-acetylglucosamine:LPS N-acetylglucosamine transferase